MNGSWMLQRAAHSVLVLFGALSLVFILVRLVPADPVIIMAGPNASPEEIAATKSALGLDKPILVQYGIYLRNALWGDLGTSLRYQRPAAAVVLESFPATAELALASLLFAVGVGVPAGMFAALKRNSFLDTLTMVVTLLGQSVPTFWLGIVCIILFAVKLRVLPTSGYGSLKNLILPSFTLGFYMMALIARMTRSSMLDVLGEGYVRTAHAKGLSEKAVLWRHIFRNALIPIVTVIGLQTGVMLGGAVVTETVFAWPGIGLLAVNSITTLDYPVVQATVILSGIIFVIINLALDLVYVAIDPRIRLGK